MRARGIALGGLMALVLMTAAAWGADLELISQGRTVELEDHLVPGKLVLFDFFADWCAPCRYLEPQIDRMGNGPGRFDAALGQRRLEGWQRPARQYHQPTGQQCCIDFLAG